MWKDNINVSAVSNFTDILRSLIVDQLPNIVGRDCAIVYAYLDYTNQSTRAVLAVLASLLKQLLRAFKSDLPDDVKYELNVMQADLQSYRINWSNYIRLILRAARYFPTVFLIFDALDEWERNGPRWQLLHCMKTLQKDGTNVKILVTSRPHISLKNFFVSMESIKIRAQVSDIEMYIREKLEPYDHLGDGVKKRIVAQLTSTAKGT